jgi:hypothetical protein
MAKPGFMILDYRVEGAIIKTGANRDGCRFLNDPGDPDA